MRLINNYIYQDEIRFDKFMLKTQVNEDTHIYYTARKLIHNFTEIPGELECMTLGGYAEWEDHVVCFLNVNNYFLIQILTEITCSSL